jgi:hypothetical protein
MPLTIAIPEQSLGGLRFEVSTGKKLEKPFPLISINKADTVVCACNPSYEGGTSRRIVI